MDDYLSIDDMILGSRFVDGISLNHITFDNIVESMYFEKFYKANEYLSLNLDRKMSPLYDELESIVELFLIDDHFDNVMFMFFNSAENLKKYKDKHTKIVEKMRDSYDMIVYSKSLVQSGGKGYQNVLSKDMIDLSDEIYVLKSQFVMRLEADILDSFFSDSESLIYDYSKMFGKSSIEWNDALSETNYLEDFFYNAFFPEDDLVALDPKTLKNSVTTVE